MENLKVPTRRITVEVLTTDGRRSLGCMFHTESLYQSGSAEDILADLVDERSFIPFQPEDANESPVLLNKRHVGSVSVPESQMVALSPREAAVVHLSRSCVLELRDGSRLTGRPLVETPSNASRTVDKFNFAPRFVPFLTDGGMVFVQDAFIVRIHPTP